MALWHALIVCLTRSFSLSSKCNVFIGVPFQISAAKLQMVWQRLASCTAKRWASPRLRGPNVARTIGAGSGQNTVSEECRGKPHLKAPAGRAAGQVTGRPRPGGFAGAALFRWHFLWYIFRYSHAHRLCWASNCAKREPYGPFGLLIGWRLIGGEGGILSSSPECLENGSKISVFRTT
jgi:hypothetical protein